MRQRAHAIQPKRPVKIFSDFQEQKKNKNRTTFQCIPKFSKMFSRKFCFHSTMLPENLEFSVEWFAFQQFNSFRNFWKLFGEMSVSFAADSKFSKVLVEWKASINYTTFDNGFATKRFMNSNHNILNKKWFKWKKKFFIIQISGKIYAEHYATY